jgi:NADPH:quinone reductase-like Zn-dependent oxidoreductase
MPQTSVFTIHHSPLTIDHSPFTIDHSLFTTHHSPTMKLLEGKTALITGASRGIGEAIAMKFAEQGANIAFTYLSSAEKALTLENTLHALGVKAIGYKSDAASYAEAEKLVVMY